MIMEDILNQNRNCALTRKIIENQIHVVVVAFVLLDLFFSVYDLNCSYTVFFNDTVVWKSFSWRFAKTY